MNRVQKKCFIVSATLHGLLIGVVLFGSALMPQSKDASFKPIRLYSIKDVTDGPTTGGNPNARSAPPPPAPEPPKQVQTETPKPPEISKPKTQPEVVKPEPVKPQKYRLDPSDLKLTKRDEPKPPPKTHPQTDDRAAREAAENRSRLVKQIGNNIRNLSSELSPTTTVELGAESGDAGPAAANYRDIVASKYTAAWNPPANLDDELAAVTVSITIARDGTVTGHRIIRSSGNPGMDRSIQTTLENVTYIEAFPAGSKDLERTYSIKFNLAAKRLLG